MPSSYVKICMNFGGFGEFDEYVTLKRNSIVYRSRTNGKVIFFVKVVECSMLCAHLCFRKFIDSNRNQCKLRCVKFATSNKLLR